MKREQKIDMFWYKMPNGEKNFGDDLGPYLVSKLSGQDISYVPILKPLKQTMSTYVRGLLKGQYQIKQLPAVVSGLFKPKVLVTIGSIITFFNNPKAEVWGAGLMRKNGKINPATFYAVRGKYTQARLKELGYQAPEAIGDPALLLPLLVPSSLNKSYKLGIIPHYIHYEKIKKECTRKDILVINLLDDIEKVISDITSCEYTISSSLHGIIVSQAYNIPSLWYNLSTEKLSGDNIKFADYFSSVDIREYNPFELNDFDAGKIVDQINAHGDINKINSNLRTLQRNLIMAAPFHVLDEYKNI